MGGGGAALRSIPGGSQGGFGVWQFVRQSCKESTRDSCSLMAAAISFYVLLSLVPLLLVGLATFGLFLGDEKAFQVVSQFLSSSCRRASWTPSTDTWPTCAGWPAWPAFWVW